jgi:hypothetical protein
MPKKSTKEESIAIIRKHMAAHGLSVVTNTSSYKEEELLCDPIIWVDEDIANRCTMEQWCDLGRASKTLHERSIEEGWAILDTILSDLDDDDDDFEDDDEDEESESNPA